MPPWSWQTTLVLTGHICSFLLPDLAGRDTRLLKVLTKYCDRTVFHPEASSWTRRGHYEQESSLFCELCPGTPAEKEPMGAFSFLSRNSSRKVSTMIAVFLRPLDKSTMLLRATHWIDSARTFWRQLLEASRLHSLERHGTRALVTVGRGHVTRGTQSIAYRLRMAVPNLSIRALLDDSSTSCFVVSTRGWMPLFFSFASITVDCFWETQSKKSRTCRGGYFRRDNRDQLVSGFQTGQCQLRQEQNGLAPGMFWQWFPQCVQKTNR